MTSGWVFLALSSLICIGAFLVGLRFSRMPEDRIDRIQFETPFNSEREPIDQIRLFGKAMMFAAPLFFVLFIALSLGLFGPIKGIQTIAVG